MALHELDLIKKFFTQSQNTHQDIILGIGDDAALTTIPARYLLASSIDTLNVGIHFPEQTAAADIGFKSLAVSLSDMAAMGAEAKAVILSLSIPEVDEHWLAEFANGFFSLANRYQIPLIGGDTNRGPLSITTMVYGWVEKTHVLLRSNAQVGDLIYVTGTLGDAGLGLELLNQGVISIDPYLLERLNRPQPRLEVASIIREFAHSAIDLSDGLAIDLQRILRASGVGAMVHVDQLPLSKNLRHYKNHDTARQLALSAGDDYELCFTIPSAQKNQLEKAVAHLKCPITYIGIIQEKLGLQYIANDGTILDIQPKGYQHF